jgi:hypothetical protein
MEIGAVLCGTELKQYLYKRGFSQKDVDKIFDAMRSGEWKYLTFAIDYRGKALEWKKYSEPPIGIWSRLLTHHLFANYRRIIWSVQLWEIRSPECIKLKDHKGMISMIEKGLEI